MGTINTISIVAFIVIGLAALAYQQHWQMTATTIDRGLWYLTMNALVAFASVWTSWLAMLIERFWAYPLLLGISIACAIGLTQQMYIVDEANE